MIIEPRHGGRGGSWRRESRRLGSFLGWLCAGDADGFRTEARLFATLLPNGLQESSAEAVGQAATLAVLRHGASRGVVVRFVLSALPAEDPVRALAVMESLTTITPAKEVPALVRVAVMTRPKLALPIVCAAMAKVPGEARCIWGAAESVVVDLAWPEPQARNQRSPCFPTASGG